MPAYFFAVIEHYDGTAWTPADPLVPDPHGTSDHLVPKNVAPQWGWEAINHHIELSGERGVPDDVSPALKAYLHEQFSDRLGTVSWLTLAEVQDHLRLGTPGFFFGEGFFASYRSTPQEPSPDALRVVFWWD